MAFSVKAAYERLTRVHHTGTLAHAYLITGVPGTGKMQLARQLTSLVLGCSEKELALHPDFYMVEPVSKSRRILMEQIRQVEEAIQKRPALGNKKVVILYQAERIALNAANAFLKTLEEPPLGTHFLLLSSQPQSLLPTLFSRCVRIPLYPTGPQEPHAWELAASQLLDQFLSIPEASVTQAFQFTRGFQAILTEAKKEVAKDIEKNFEAEKKHYKNTTDGKWLEEKEIFLKASLESACIQLRQKLLSTLENRFAEGLRCACRRELPEDLALRRISEIPKLLLFKHLDTIYRLQRLLDRGVHEPLALEACLLEIFCPTP